MGLDVLGQLNRWKDPERVVALCRLLVRDRPGEKNFDWPGFYNRVPNAQGRVQMVTAPRLSVSATELRKLASAGQPLTGLVPDAVAEYIHQHGLYLTEREGRTAS